MKKLVVAAFMLSCLSSLGFAMSGSGPDLDSERYGVGVVAQNFFNQTDVFSLRYWANKNWGLEGLLGYYNYSNSVNGSMIAGKYLRSMKKEKYMNLYGFGMLGFINTNQASGTSTTAVAGTLVRVGVGVEFFIDELPNLGLSFEAGINDKMGDYYNNLGQKGVDFTSNPFNTVSLHYYFK